MDRKGHGIVSANFGTLLQLILGRLANGLACAQGVSTIARGFAVGLPCFFIKASKYA